MKYPRLRDLEARARRRLPPFVFAYLDSGTGHDVVRAANRAYYDGMTLTPRFLRGRIDADLSASILGQTYDAPFGVAPIGLSSMIWPGAETILAAAASRNGFPYTLSTVAGDSIENVAAAGGAHTWFQLYATKDKDITFDLLRRARDCGVETLIVTADVPAPSRRERMRIAGAPLGSRGNSSFSPRVIWQSALHPGWALRMAAMGGPKFRNMAPYADRHGNLPITSFIGQQLNGTLDWDYLQDIRAAWPGKMMLKGILDGQDAVRAVGMGVDGLVLSNHGGRQLDAAPHPLERLPAVRAAVGDNVPLVVDSGIQSGLDIVKALVCGADFVLLGRAFMYAVAALGRDGGNHAAAVLLEEVRDVMAQLGVSTIAGLRDVEINRHG